MEGNGLGGDHSMSHIDELKAVIHELHGAEATHRESVRVKEVFGGKTIWDGIVAIFDIKNHHDTDTVYAWLPATRKPRSSPQYVTVLHINPTLTPLKAVQAFIVQELRINAAQD
jgi:hypothetical protein